MPNKFFNGIGSYWTQHFEDRQVLDTFGFACKEALTSAYIQLSNLALSISHDGIPVFDRTKWDIVVIKAGDVLVSGGKYKFPIPSSLNAKGLRLAPLLLPSLAFPKLILVQGSDFIIDGQYIVFNADPFTNPDIPVKDVSGDQEVSLWAPGSEVDTNRIWECFGHFTKEWDYSTEAYKDFTRSLFHTFMFGPLLDRVETGLQFMAGLPVAAGGTDETVISVLRQQDRWLIKTNLREYTIPLDVAIRVQAGDKLELFQVLTDAIKVSDYITNPGWWNGKILQLPAEIGTTNDINTAFDQYLKYNTFLIEADLSPFLANMTGTEPFSIDRLASFISEFKPSYTYFFASYSLGFSNDIATNDLWLENAYLDHIDIYTRPECYYFGRGTDTEFFLYHFDGAENFDGSIAMFNSVLNDDPLTQLYFNEQLLRFDGATGLLFDGSEAFIGHDGTSVTFYCCDCDPITCVAQDNLQDTIRAVTPVFDGGFEFNGELKWGGNDMPVYDIDSLSLALEEQDVLNPGDECETTPVFNIDSRIHKLFDGELLFNNGWLFDRAVTFDGEYKFDQQLSFGAIHNDTFDDDMNFDGMQAAVFDSYYEDPIAIEVYSMSQQAVIEVING